MDDFDLWLMRLHKEFLQLSSEQKNRTLDFVISILDATQLYHLSKVLHCLLKRDFITQLPTELLHCLMRYLDADTLITCCKVSQEWNTVISSCASVWKRACSQLGVQDGQNLLAETGNSDTGEHYKTLYERSKQTLDVLRAGRAFSDQYLCGHSDRVMAVYYRNGLIATGSDDHCVRIWDSSSAECIKVFRAHTVADLKFDDTQVLTASFDTTAACWDMEGNLKQRFQGHVAAIFSIDYSNDLDLVVTGSADSTVKVWRLSNGTMLKTLTQYRSAWIIQVCLYKWNSADVCICNDNSGSKICDSYACLNRNSNQRNTEQRSINRCCIVSRDNISLHLWYVDTTNHNIQIDHSEEWNNDLQMALLPGLCRKQNSFMVAFLNEATNEIHIYECNLSPRHLRQIRSNNAGETLLNCMVEVHMCSIPSGAVPQYYLGSGVQWNVFILDKSSNSELCMVRHENQQMFSCYALSPDVRPSKRGSTFCLCETSWMNGLGVVKNTDPVFVTSLRNNNVHLLKWNLDTG